MQRSLPTGLRGHAYRDGHMCNVIRTESKNKHFPLDYLSRCYRRDQRREVMVSAIPPYLTAQSTICSCNQLREGHLTKAKLEKCFISMQQSFFSMK